MAAGERQRDDRQRGGVSRGWCSTSELSWASREAPSRVQLRLQTNQQHRRGSLQAGALQSRHSVSKTRLQ